MSEHALPTAGELARLTEACRVDAGSPLFVDLADAYLALGRPRDAIKVALRGLKSNPDFLEGRIALSRAFVALHQWKEAQVELVKVVKVNRGYREAFVLLGEVLLRRGDFDRAFPVLQHAQNLDPANPRTLVLLKHARARKPLEPPPPPPLPLEPQPTGAAPVISGTPAPKPATDRKPQALASARSIAPAAPMPIAPVVTARATPTATARGQAAPTRGRPSPSQPLAVLGGPSSIAAVADDEELTEVADEPADALPFDPLDPAEIAPLDPLAAPRIATDPAELASAVAAAAAALPVTPRGQPSTPRPVRPAPAPVRPPVMVPPPMVTKRPPAPAPARPTPHASPFDFDAPVDEDEFEAAEVTEDLGHLPRSDDTEPASSLGVGGAPAGWGEPPKDTVEAPVITDDAVTRVAARPRRPEPEAEAGSDPVGEAIRARLPLATNPTADVPAIPAKVAPTPPPPSTRDASPRRSPAARAPVASPALDENYLNNLLVGTAGAGEEVDIQPPDEWRMSARRSFVLLFAALFAVVVGGISWYWHSERQRAAAVAGHLDAAKALILSTSYQDLDRAITETRKALERDRENVYAVTVYAEIGALSALLYKSDPSEADIATSAVAKEVDRGGERGRRELLMARSALTLATLANLDKPVDRLTEAQAALEVWLEDHPEDLWVRWLQGRAALAAGDRRRARSAFELAATPDGPVIAVVDRADMLVDEGDLDAALALYQQALERAPDHPLAVVGRALARAERGVDLEATRLELVALDPATSGARVDSYKNLALAYVYYGLADEAGFARSLSKSVGLSEPRYLARVGLARLLAGKISDAVDVRSRIKWFGTERPEIDPLVAVLDAELYLAYGLPKSALSAIGTAPGLRASEVRGQALFDQREYPAAVTELAAALAIAPEDRDVALWSAAARYLATSGKERKAADSDLDALREQSKSRIASFVQGLAHLRAGVSDARGLLEASLGDQAGGLHPLAYRAHVVLAELDFRDGRLAEARKHLDAALLQNRGFLPIHGLLGRLLLLERDYPGAVEELSRVVDEQMADSMTELAFAEALVSQAEVSDADRERARQAVRRVAAADPAQADLARVAALVDPALVKELELGGK